MKFSPQEIDAAIQLHQLGLPWEPQSGHYVWDKTGLIEQPSPFQNGVYFILDLKHFLRRAGTLEALKRSMVWLPTWHAARDLLESLGADSADIARALQTHNALEYRHELLTLYGLSRRIWRRCPAAQSPLAGWRQHGLCPDEAKRRAREGRHAIERCHP